MMNNKLQWRAVALTAILALFAAPMAQADFDQAMNYFKSGKYVEAAAEFQTLVDNSPNYDWGYYMLGVSLLQMKKPNDAKTNLLKAIELNGERFEYHEWLAKTYKSLKQYSNVIATLKSAEPLAADSAAKLRLYTLSGYAYIAMEEWSDAAETLEKAKAIKADPTVMSQLGRAYYGLGHYDKAAPAFRSAVKGKSSDTASTRLLAESLINLGAETKNEAQKNAYYTEASEAAQAYLQTKPNDYQAHNLCGRASLGSKDFSKAEQSFRKVLALKPDYCYAMVNLGKTYIAQKRWTDAEAQFNDAASCAPRMALVYENLGFVIEKQKRLEEAIAQYEKAMQIKPSAGLRAAVDRCQYNIETRDHNQAMEEQQQQEEDAARAEEERYAEEMRKQKEWEEAQRKRDD